MSGGVLSPDRRDRFARNGFLVLRDAIDPALLADARESVRETVPVSLDDDEALREVDDRLNYWGDLARTEPFARINDRLFELGRALVGPTLESPGSFVQVAVRVPTESFASDPGHPTTTTDGNPHLDPFGREDGTFRPFTLGATVYLDDVAPRAGGFTVWPGSHWAVADFFAHHSLAAFSDSLVGGILDDAHAPFEVTGPAGTVVLWHPLVVHTGGQHLGRGPRLASFTRMHRENERETMREAARRPFAHWTGIDQSGRPEATRTASGG